MPTPYVVDEAHYCLAHHGMIPVLFWLDERPERSAISRLCASHVTDWLTSVPTPNDRSWSAVVANRRACLMGDANRDALLLAASSEAEASRLRAGIDLTSPEQAERTDAVVVHCLSRYGSVGEDVDLGRLERQGPEMRRLRRGLDRVPYYSRHEEPLLQPLRSGLRFNLPVLHGAETQPTMYLSGKTDYPAFLKAKVRVGDGATREAVIPFRGNALAFISDDATLMILITDRGFWAQFVGGCLVATGHDIQTNAAPIFVSAFWENVRRNFALALRDYADRNCGFSWTDGQRLTTPLGRRSGARAAQWRYWWGLYASEFGPWVRANLPVIPRDWRARDAERCVAAGLTAAPARTRPTAWNWNRIPAEVAAIMERDLTLHLEEPGR